ncbi:MAG: efflux RND transporter periplasmic adaptor subunit [Angelakisella sp.]
MKKKYKIIVIAALVVVTVAYGLYTVMKPVTVHTQPLVTGPLGDSFTAQGTLVPNESRLIVANTTGIVSALPAQAGRSISTGDTLAILDNATLRKELQQQVDGLKFQKKAMTSENSIRREQLRMQLQNAELEYYRQFGKEIGSAAAISDLALSSYLMARNAYHDAEEAYNNMPPGVSSITSSQLFSLEQQMISARKNFIITRNSTDDTNKAYYAALIDSCKAQLGMLGDYSAQQLQVTIDYLEERLNPAPVAAPFDGTVWEVYVEQGSFVAENTPIAKVFQNDGMKLTAKLLSEDTTGLTIGDVVDCTLTDGTAFTAEIIFVSPVAEQSVSGIGLSENRCMVELKPIDLPKQAGAGYQVDLTFTSVAAPSALSAPSSAILPMETGSGVYLVKGGKAVLTPVETGLRCGGRVELLSGVADGDIIIVNPYDSKVKNGNRVNG